jgi:hypothetical protein
MITVFFIGQAVLGSGVATCIWLMARECRERLRERDERRLLQLTVRSLGAAWDEVALGRLDIDEFCTAARRAHLALAEGRVPPGPAPARQA